MLPYEKYRRQMIDTVLALLPLLAMACYYYGPRVLIMAAISVGSAAAADYFCLLLQGERWWRKYDFSAGIAGLTYVLMLPASAPYWLVIFGAVFAILVVRHPFGGHYHTLFNPALTAFAFVVLCWNDLVTQYPASMTQLPLTASLDVPLYSSPARQLMLGGSNNIDWLDALLGNFYGPMGTTCIAVLLCCGIYLIYRRTIIWQIPVASLAVVAAAAWFFPRINGSRTVSVLMELTSGVLLFSVLFVAAMDNGEIQSRLGKWTYGVLLGGLMVLFRHLSRIELVAPFVVIIMNAVDHRCDAYAAHLCSGVKLILRLTWKGIRKTGQAGAGAFNKVTGRLSRWAGGEEGKR